MLVLGRKVNEVIRIGDDIRIMICEVKGDRVLVGIDAPKDVVVHRSEVYHTEKDRKCMESRRKNG